MPHLLDPDFTKAQIRNEGHQEGGEKRKIKNKLYAVHHSPIVEAVNPRTIMNLALREMKHLTRASSNVHRCAFLISNISLNLNVQDKNT